MRVERQKKKCVDESEPPTEAAPAHFSLPWHRVVHHDDEELSILSYERGGGRPMVGHPPPGVMVGIIQPPTKYFASPEGSIAVCYP